MIGRLGIPTSMGGQSKPANSNVPSSSSTNTASGRSSITSATSGMMNLGSSSMSSLSGGISKFSNMTKLVTETLVSSNGDGEKKAKDDRKLQMSQAVQMLEDISLQSPSTHLGLVLAYTGRNCSPVIHPGLKFTWFRMRGQDQIDQVEESQRAWYAPSVDDVGCTICVQCEDNFEQGLSRYLECGPLQSDPLLRSATESAINSGFFETKGVCVSLGLLEHDTATSISSSVVTVDGSTVPLIPAPDPFALHTTLSKDSAFLQLNGRCTVEIDEQGIFISIPTFHARNSNSSNSNSRSHNNNNSNNTATTNEDNNNNKTTFNTSRRGLRLPISSQMKVHCTAPSSLILSVPLMQQQQQTLSPVSEKGDDDNTNDDGLSSTASSPMKAAGSNRNQNEDNGDVNMNHSAPENGSTATTDDATTANPKEDVAMKQFLSSSILAIPWTYEGHHLSPETYLSGLGHSKLSPEERDRLLKEAEEDAMIFAQTVVALTEFIASVPEGSKELLLCFSCNDRLTRDTLVLTMRALSCTSSSASRYERRKVLPWVQFEEDEQDAHNISGNNHSHYHSNNNHTTGTNNAKEVSENEWKRRLKVVEEEAAALKRERNELTKQLLETKEELSITKQKMQKASKISSSGSVSTSGSSVSVTLDQNNSNHGALTHRSEEEMSTHSDHNHNNNGNEGEQSMEKSDDVLLSSDPRVLQVKLIELDNKLNMTSKREQDVLRQRDELEQQTTKLLAELESTKRKKDDAREKLLTLQRLHDQQSMMLRKMEKDIDTLQEKLVQIPILMQSLEQVQGQLQQSLQDVQVKTTQLQEQQQEIQTLRTQHTADVAQITTIHETHAVQAQLWQRNVSHVEQQLSEALLQNKQQERAMLAQQEKLNQQELLLQALPVLQAQCDQATRDKEQLQAEINHLNKKTDSLSRDLKRIMKENAQSLSEFEKALIRKSGECDELYYQLVELREMEKARMQSGSGGNSSGEDSASAAIMAKLSSMLSNNNAQSTHSTGSDNNSNGNNNGVENNNNAQLSSRVTSMFRRMSASAAALTANVGSSSTGEDAA